MLCTSLLFPANSYGEAKKAAGGMHKNVFVRNRRVPMLQWDR